MAKKEKRSLSWGFWVGMLMLFVFIGYVLIHLGDLNKFIQLVRRAQPAWLLLGLLLQTGTYWSAGMIWYWVTWSESGATLPIRTLARLAVEKLSIDHLFPTAGLSGSLVVMRAMRRRGLPASAVLEAIIIDIFTYYISFAIAAVLALIVLVFSYEETAVFTELFAFFALVVVGVPLIMWWLLRHREWQPPPRLARIRMLTQALAKLREVSMQRISNPGLLFIGTFFHLLIFILDGGTLWAMLQVTGTSATLYTAFAALVVGSMAAAVSLLPGGLGSFEVGCTTTLTLLGVSIEAALAATLLLRGLTLWLPLLPGILLARREISGNGKLPPEEDETDVSAQ